MSIFDVKIDYISETQCAVALGFKRDVSFGKIPSNEKMSELLNIIDKLASINNERKIKIIIVADISGSMNGAIPLIENVSFMDKTFVLPKYKSEMRSGAQIYTLATLSYILKLVSDILNKKLLAVDIELTIIPFNNTVNEEYVLNIRLNDVENIGEIVIEHMLKCNVSGSTNPEKAFEYILQKMDDTKRTIPSVIITTTDGEFNDMNAVKIFWERFNVLPFTYIGCIGMGLEAGNNGIKLLNNGCLISGSFSVNNDEGSDNIFQLLPNIISDFSYLCSLGMDKSLLPSSVKVSCKNGVIKYIFKDDTLYLAKSYCRVYAIIDFELNEELNEELNPILVLTDNLNNETRIKLKDMESNCDFGVVIDIINKINEIKFVMFDEITESKKIMMEKLHSIHNCLYFINKYNEIKSSSLEMSMIENMKKKIEEYNDIMCKDKKEVDEIMRKRIHQLNKFNIEMKQIKRKLKEYLSVLNKIQSEDQTKEQIKTMLIQTAKLSIEAYKNNFDSKINFIICGSNNTYRETSTYITQSRTTAVSSDVFVTQSSLGQDTYSNEYSQLLRRCSYPSLEQTQEQEIDEKYCMTKCNICLENDANLISLKCGHPICCKNNIECFQAFELLEIKNCPICRVSLDENLPIVEIKNTEFGTKCKKCVEKNNCNPKFSSIILNCGHLGYCSVCCKEHIEENQNEIYYCDICKNKRNKICNVYVI